MSKIADGKPVSALGHRKAFYFLFGTGILFLLMGIIGGIWYLTWGPEEKPSKIVKERSCPSLGTQYMSYAHYYSENKVPYIVYYLGHEVAAKSYIKRWGGDAVLKKMSERPPEVHNCDQLKDGRRVVVYKYP